MTTLLVANRGEIARRIFRTAKRLGMRTVAVHSDADAKLPFVREADRAIRIGPAPAGDSYLSVERIVAAAHEGGATLVHPGYGFLAEDPRLAEALHAAGIAYAGPSPDALAALGDKGRAKAIAARAGAPVLEDYRGDDQRDEAFDDAARAIGYPVMVKPVAGGGGIGMQLVREARALREALARARRVAAAAFGNERILIERAVERPRHVEVQILADARGTIVALGERDCSAQRRHQKIVEECPSPAVDGPLRERLERAAVAIAREAGYVNAGTVEFLLDERGSFWFIEVNARLQVEHPVTEIVFGVDLVEQQLRIALGERLDLIPRPSGHAVEARVYAEDPASGFLPSAGRLLRVRWPEDLRVDAGYEEGDTVTTHYDPLIAKLIAAGADRAAAVAALADGLARTAVLGVRTNVAFLGALAGSEELRHGRMDTGFIDRKLPRLAPPGREAPAEAIAVAAASLLAEQPHDARDPWLDLGSWRVAGPHEGVVVLDDRVVRVAGRGPYVVEGHRVARIGADWSVDAVPAIAAGEGGVIWVWLAGSAYEVQTAPRARDVDALAATEVVSPMPGVVLSVHVSNGQRVVRGELLCVVEAMKMELRVAAPAEGTIARVLCSAGQRVARGQRLAEFDPA